MKATSYLLLDPTVIAWLAETGPASINQLLGSFPDRVLVLAETTFNQVVDSATLANSRRVVERLIDLRLVLNAVAESDNSLVVDKQPMDGEIPTAMLKEIPPDTRERLADVILRLYCYQALDRRVQILTMTGERYHPSLADHLLLFRPHQLRKELHGKRGAIESLLKLKKREGPRG